jgi:hypothetical protein
MDSGGRGSGPSRGGNSGDEIFGLLAGSGVFLVQVFALVPGLLPFTGLLGVFILLLMLPMIVVGLAGFLVVLPVVGLWRLFGRWRH